MLDTPAANENSVARVSAAGGNYDGWRCASTDPRNRRHRRLGRLDVAGASRRSPVANVLDAPGSISNPAAWLNASIVVAFPSLCILSIAGSWIVWAWRKHHPTRFFAGAQIVVALLPLLPVTYVLGAMVVETVGVIASGQPLGLHSTIIKH
jgi:hypothetical protein